MSSSLRCLTSETARPFLTRCDHSAPKLEKTVVYDTGTHHLDRLPRPAIEASDSVDRRSARYQPWTEPNVSVVFDDDTLAVAVALTP